MGKRQEQAQRPTKKAAAVKKPAAKKAVAVKKPAAKTAAAVKQPAAKKAAAVKKPAAKKAAATNAEGPSFVEMLGLQEGDSVLNILCAFVVLAGVDTTFA